MIEIRLDPASLNAFKNDLKQLIKVINSQDLNVYRAKKFKEFTKKSVRSGGVRLVPLSSATIALAGVHDPEFLTGKLMDAMKAEPGPGTSAIAGYWEPSDKVPGKNLTYAKLATIQTTGYRIPLTGDKGARVRAWLFMNGLGLFGKSKGTKTKMQSIIGKGQWLIVPPRPFMHRALDMYLESDGDIKAASEFMDKELRRTIP